MFAVGPLWRRCEASRDPAVPDTNEPVAFNPKGDGNFAYDLLNSSRRVGIAFRQTLAKRLGVSACRIDQRRTRIQQPGPHPDLQQIELRRLAAMPDRPQQLRVDPRQASQRARIQFVVFPRALANQLYLPRVRHDRLMSQTRQKPADPGRMRTHFERNPARRHASEPFRHPFLRARYTLLE